MRRRTTAALSAIILAGALATGQAVAHAQGQAPQTAIPSGTDCTDRTLYTPFTFDGDTNPYYLANGGDFEGTYTNWFGTGISRSHENEPWQVGGKEDASSLVLTRAGATLSAPKLCVRDDEPTLRFFYKSPGTPGAKLLVKMRTTSVNGSTARTVTIDGSTDAGWHVSEPISIEDNTDSTGTQRLLLDFQSGGGAWNVDDVYVDPWKWVIK